MIDENQNNSQVVSNPFADLPTLMKTILMHEENVDLNIAIEKNNKLTHQQGDVMMSVIRKIILKTITPNELVTTIIRDVGLDGTRAKKLALDLLTKRFLPMEWYIGKVQPLIHELGGNVAEALAEAKKLYPEVYEPSATKTETAPAETAPSVDWMREFDAKINTVRGKAELLLRLTGLSSQLEETVAAKSIAVEDGERLMQNLDAVSFAVNTQDLNPFEVNSLKRKISRVIQRLNQSSQ